MHTDQESIRIQKMDVEIENQEQYLRADYLTRKLRSTETEERARELPLSRGNAGTKKWRTDFKSGHCQFKPLFPGIFIYLKKNNDTKKFIINIDQSQV